MTLAEYNDSIRSRKDFAAFAQALSADLHDNPETWENGSLERFLEALAAWAEDASGQRPDWQTVGDMLMAAKGACARPPWEEQSGEGVETLKC